MPKEKVKNCDLITKHVKNLISEVKSYYDKNIFLVFFFCKNSSFFFIFIYFVYYIIIHGS